MLTLQQCEIALSTGKLNKRQTEVILNIRKNKLAQANKYGKRVNIEQYWETQKIVPIQRNDAYTRRNGSGKRNYDSSRMMAPVQQATVVENAYCVLPTVLNCDTGERALPSADLLGVFANAIEAGLSYEIAHAIIQRATASVEGIRNVIKQLLNNRNVPRANTVAKWLESAGNNISAIASRIVEHIAYWLPKA